MGEGEREDQKWHSLLLLVLVTVHVGVVVRGTGHDVAGAEGRDEGESCEMHCAMRNGYRKEKDREKPSLSKSLMDSGVSCSFVGRGCWAVYMVAACVYSRDQRKGSRRDAVTRAPRAQRSVRAMYCSSDGEMG